jgi:hypothetical protein
LNEARKPFDFPVRTASIEYQGVKYTFAELTLAQNDEIRELATNAEKEYDVRLGMRLTVCYSAVDPKIEMEQLAAFPSTLYAKVFDLVNALHDPDLEGTKEDPTKPKGKDDPGKN